MGLILNIETATDVCSVALSGNGSLLSLREDVSGQSHSRLLTTLIMECLEMANHSLQSLDAISVSKGPGSYTGLRIGVATAKGLCYGLNKPLLSVNTLQSMAFKYKAAHSVQENTWLCPMIDARRMEVYSAFFNRECLFEKPTAATVITPGIFDEILDMHPVIFFGDGMLKSREILENHKNAIFQENFRPSATGMIPFSEAIFNSSGFEDLAGFEPFYLKDFFTPRQL
jgi:tRNA threonylcarbamoyladenosine biosynthesis protein TsaB